MHLTQSSLTQVSHPRVNQLRSFNSELVNPLIKTGHTAMFLIWPENAYHLDNSKMHIYCFLIINNDIVSVNTVSLATLAVLHANKHIQKGDLQTSTKYKVWYFRGLNMKLNHDQLVLIHLMRILIAAWHALCFGTGISKAQARPLPWHYVFSD